MSQVVSAQQGSASIPEAKHTVPATPRDLVDEMLVFLKERGDDWAKVTIPRKLEILDNILATTLECSERWVAAALRAKGIEPETPQEGEEWIGGPSLVIRNIRLLRQSLEDIHLYGTPRLPEPPTTRANGQVVVQAFPTDQWDKMVFQGFTGEVWMQPGVTLENLKDNMAAWYRTPSPKGKVALVLGAGNVSSIGPMDTLYKLFVEGQVVILKMNPVNEYLGPIFEECFLDLHERGYFRVVYGGAAEGDYLAQHELVDEIHITGSDKTHDAIVFGVGEEGARRKAQRKPRNDKRVTSELGNVSPIIVVPGRWSQGDLNYQGVNLVSSLTNNAGFNCNATRVIVTHRAWSQREPLLKAIDRAFEHAPSREAYYPGADQRQKAFVAAHPEAREFGPKRAGRVPWTIISGLDPTNANDMCFTTEAFCGVTSEVALEAADVVQYIRMAVDFCNDTLWGTLNAAIIVHPSSLKDPTIAAAVEQAIADLRYGSVAVNHWPALAYGFVSTTWGAFPGHTPEDVRSGIGVVHNTYLFDKPEKTVVRGPFRVKPKPAWFVNHRTSHELGRKITAFNADPSFAKVPGILFSAIRG